MHCSRYASQNHPVPFRLSHQSICLTHHLPFDTSYTDAFSARSAMPREKLTAGGVDAMGGPRFSFGWYVLNSHSGLWTRSHCDMLNGFFLLSFVVDVDFTSDPMITSCSLVEEPSSITRERVDHDQSFRSRLSLQMVSFFLKIVFVSHSSKPLNVAWYLS